MPVGFICDPRSGGCGFASRKPWGLGDRCPSCWGYYECKQTLIAGEEEDDGEERDPRLPVLPGYNAQSLRGVEAERIARMSLGFAGIDRMLGADEASDTIGMAVRSGHVIQCYGEPGSGKSTLTLQIVERFARINKARVLYAQLEESVAGKMKPRADRLGLVMPKDVIVTEERDLDRLFRMITELEPDLAVIDSLPKVELREYATGSTKAAEAAADDLYKLAQVKHIGMILINQVNKSGDDFAGAKAIEHMVDTSWRMRRHRDKRRRLLECDFKNRYNETPVSQWFTMSDTGLCEIEGPTREEDELDDGDLEARPAARPRRGARLRSHGA